MASQPLYVVSDAFSESLKSKAKGKPQSQIWHKMQTWTTSRTKNYECMARQLNDYLRVRKGVQMSGVAQH